MKNPPNFPSVKTRIVATIGPACDDPSVLVRMIQAGMTVARLNFSHGTFDEHARRILALREASRVAGRDLAIMADLPGPKMRIGQLATEPILLATGQMFTLTTRPGAGDESGAWMTFEPLPRVVNAGNMLFLNDGLIQLEVERVEGPDVRCRVRVGGELRSRKGLNLPGIHLGIGAFTSRDRECLAFALAHGVDAVSQSFVESAADIEAVRAAAREMGRVPFILAKIERAGALERIDEILAAADGIMVARGDLGVEVAMERIAIIQKSLVRKAVWLGKPVIIATQMLESMTHSRQPTRAEATDVANAVLDGADAVMLSGESAMGEYPVEAVATLARIAAVTEPHRQREHLWERLKAGPAATQPALADLLSLGVEAIMECSPPAAVVVPTRSGTTARSIARYRLPVWVVAPTGSVSVSRQLRFTYGVQPILVDGEDVDWNRFSRDWIAEAGLEGSLAILIQGPSPKNPSGNYRLELLELPGGLAS